MSIKCKFCGSKEYVKSGFIQEIQRYKCKDCKKHFTEMQIQEKAPLAYSKKSSSFENTENVTPQYLKQLINFLKSIFSCEKR